MIVWVFGFSKCGLMFHKSWREGHVRLHWQVCGSQLNVRTIYCTCRKYTSALSKNRDVIVKSHLVRSGPPALYQLRPTTGALRRMTLGKKDVNETNKTGNRSRKVRPGQHAGHLCHGRDVWFEVVEDGRRSRSGGQTSEVTVSQIHGFTGKTLPFAVTIIDNWIREQQRGREGCRHQVEPVGTDPARSWSL